jgi:uncharacterized protein with GYD domain
MAKYLIQGSYTAEGVRGLLKEGGVARRLVVRQLIEKLGGKLEAFYYAFGGDDIYAIVELPDNVDSLAVSMAVTAGGSFHAGVVVLLTPEEVDQATKKAATLGYRAPGQ